MQDDYSALERFLGDASRPAETLSFHELQGFLFATASSPETVPPSEWLPMIGNDESLNFADEAEAERILGLVMNLYNETNLAVLARRNALPHDCAFHDDLWANFDDDASISQWSRGFSAGHDWLSETWEEYLFGELADECSATCMVLSFFSSRQLAQAYFEESAPRKKVDRETTFEEFAGAVRDLFPDSLASYANLGRSIFEAVAERGARRQKPARSTRVRRNAPCPCGSGRKYKSCCGRHLH
jgi:uncharacterized protein